MRLIPPQTIRRLFPMNAPAKNWFALLAVITFFCTPSAYAQPLNSAQIKQIEEIAQTIASQHNANSKAFLDEMTVSTRAIAIGRNVQFEYVLRVKKGLPPTKLKEFSDETRREILPKACQQNANNPAFDRGLYYTFAYMNTYGEKLAEFNVDKAICQHQ